MIELFFPKEKMRYKLNVFIPFLNTFRNIHHVIDLVNNKLIFYEFGSRQLYDFFGYFEEYI